MAAILNCDIPDLPTEVTMHKFIQYFLPYNKDMADTVKCLKTLTHSAKPIQECRNPLGHSCPGRFGTNLTQSEACHKRLNGSIIGNGDFDKKMSTYKACVAKKHSTGASCLSELQSYCNARRVRSVKTVRLRMMHAERLLALMPDLRVVHVIRDPRAVVRSRIKASSYSSLYSDRDPVREAKIFCQQMTEDVRLRHQLEKSYPDRIMTVLFEVRFAGLDVNLLGGGGWNGMNARVFLTCFMFMFLRIPYFMYVICIGIMPSLII